MQTCRLFFRSLPLSFVLFFVFCAPFFLVTPIIHAQTLKPWDQANSICVGGADRDVATIAGVQCLVANILSVAITLVGMAGFVMMIFGAFKLMVAGNNAKGMEDSRATIGFAVLGLIVALASYMIVNFIADFTGVQTIKGFKIPSSDTSFSSP